MRKARNLTQEQLAEMIDIDPRNLSKIEVGTCFVKAETLSKILKALNVTTEQLFSNDHIKPEKELVKEIKQYIEMIKDKPEKLEKIHKIIRFFAFGE